MIKQISIFDLDGTTIDSSHRQVTDSKGNLDLNKWFENAIPSKIFKDKVLPLANQIRRRNKKGDYTIVHTARNMTFADYEFLMENEDKPEDTRFRVIYQMVKSMSKLRWARPCLKQYQYNYIDSRICQVMPEHFDLVAMLPTQRFQKANANYVYSRSREKF